MRTDMFTREGIGTVCVYLKFEKKKIRKKKSKDRSQTATVVIKAAAWAVAQPTMMAIFGK